MLRALGARAEIIVCDSADSNDVLKLFGADSPGSVLQAAGMADKGMAIMSDMSRIQSMCAPKAFGAWYLHCATAQKTPEARILFSSVASGLGNVGLANYATGNACLDAFALSLRANGMVARSLQWPVRG